jgi:hypothetical protein
MTPGKIAAIGVLCVILLVGMFGMGTLSFFNTSTSLITAYEAKLDANKADFDNMWKTIQQVAQVPDQHKEGFKDVMTSYAAARSSGEGAGSFLSIMKEAVPDFSGNAELHAKIQTVVEAQRGVWTTRQKELRDIKRAHDTLVRTFPGVAYNALIGHEELVAVVITSTKTEATFETGMDDDVNLFPSGN